MSNKSIWTNNNYIHDKSKAIGIQHLVRYCMLGYRKLGDTAKNGGKTEQKQGKDRTKTNSLW